MHKFMHAAQDFEATLYTCALVLHCTLVRGLFCSLVGKAVCALHVQYSHADGALGLTLQALRMHTHKVWLTLL